MNYSKLHSVSVAEPGLSPSDLPHASAGGQPPSLSSPASTTPSFPSPGILLIYQDLALNAGASMSCGHIDNQPQSYSLDSFLSKITTDLDKLQEGKACRETSFKFCRVVRLVPFSRVFLH